MLTFCNSLVGKGLRSIDWTTGFKIGYTEQTQNTSTYLNKMKNKTYITVVSGPKSYRKIIEKEGKSIP